MGKLPVIFWPIFLIVFFGIGLEGAFLAANRKVISSNPKYASADNYLRSTLGFPNASVHLQEIFNTLPKGRPIVFVCRGNESSLLTYYILSSLALPRPVIKVEMGTAMPGRLKNNRPSALLFYQLPPPSIGGKRVQVGSLAILLTDYPQ